MTFDTARDLKYKGNVASSLQAWENARQLDAERICATREWRLLSWEPRATQRHPYAIAVCAEVGYGDRFEVNFYEPHLEAR